jgi:hypothetical protein
MADTQLSLAALILEQKYRGRMVHQINRRSVLLKLLKCTPAMGQNAAWGAKGSGQVAEQYAEGADVSNFGSNTQLQALLNWGLYRSNFHLTGTARRGAQFAATPEMQSNQLLANIEDATMQLTTTINQALWNDPGTSGYVAGMSPAVGTTTNIYAGIDRTVYSFWQPYNVNPGSLTPLSFAQIRADQAAIYIQSGEQPDIGLCDPNTFNTLGSLFDANRRYMVDTVPTARGEVKLEGGFKAIEFDGTYFVKDKDSPANTITYLNSQYVHIEYLPPPSDLMVQLAELGMETQADDGFGIIPLGFWVEKLAKTGDSDKYMMTWNGQLVVRRPNACGQRVNIQIAS